MAELQALVQEWWITALLVGLSGTSCVRLTLALIRGRSSDPKVLVQERTETRLAESLGR